MKIDRLILNTMGATFRCHLAEVVLNDCSILDTGGEIKVSPPVAFSKREIVFLKNGTRQKFEKAAIEAYLAAKIEFEKDEVEIFKMNKMEK